jgi:hypothetical protein
MKIKIDIKTLTEGKGFGGIEVGGSIQALPEFLGGTDYPPVRLTKKSKILNHLYGNVTVLSEQGRVIHIDVDFHGNRENTVDAEDLKRMTYAEWLDFAVHNNCSVKRILDITHIGGKGFLVNISASGEIGILSFR